MRKLLAAALLTLLASTSAFAETIKVGAGGDLQAALNRAVAGDVVAIQPQATFIGTFRLPPKAGVVTLTSDSVLPVRRLAPTDAALLGTIVSATSEMALDIQDSKNWKLDGLRLLPNVGGFGDIITIWRSDNIYMDRLLIIAPTLVEQKRAILGNGTHITLTRSYIAGIYRRGQDSQAFCAFDGAGPYLISDNYLEAASENILFGGSNSSTIADIPADILIENNFVTKPLSWKADLEQRGFGRNVKNLLELKAAKRVVIRNNIFENNWADGQAGAGILFTVRNDASTAPWSTVEDVLFSDNTLRNSLRGINILGYDSYSSSEQLKRIIMQDNLIDIYGSPSLMIGGEAKTITFIRNRLNQPIVPEPWMSPALSLYSGGVWPSAELLDGPRPALYAAEGLTWAGNMSNQTNPCYFGDSVGCGVVAFDTFARGYKLEDTVVIPPVVEPPVVDPPVVTPPVDPLLDVKAQIAALDAKLTATQTQLTATQAKLNAALLYLSKEPNATKIMQVVQYLRAIPR